MAEEPWKGVDPLDVRILRAMGIRPYERWPKSPEALKPTHLARTLGTSVDTVKERIARMEAVGVLAGYQVMPNLRHLGLAASAFLFRVPDADHKERAVAELQLMAGILEVHDFMGPALCVDFLHDTPQGLEARLRELRERTGDGSPLLFYHRDMPPAPRPLTPLDWRILRALRGRARRPLPEVAREVGVSLRTVKRHYDRMAGEGAFFAYPLLDPSKVPGLILFELLFYLRPDAGRGAVNRILGAFDDRQVHAYVPASPRLGHFDLLVFATSTAEVDELRRRGAALEGVERVEAWLFRGFHDLTHRLDAAIADRARGALPERPTT